MMCHTLSLSTIRPINQAIPENKKQKHDLIKLKHRQTKIQSALITGILITLMLAAVLTSIDCSILMNLML